MPSLLSRFLGKKKIVDPTPLLDGEKYEAVPKTLSPTAAVFQDSAQIPKFPSKAKSREQSDRGPGLYIRRKRTSSPSAPESKAIQSVPVLSLSLPDAKLEEKKLHGLGVVFENMTDGLPGMDDEALGEKRLTPPETLTLVQKTAEVICERGLETLGVMRPHWFASPRQQEIQLRLISRFLQTLSSQQSGGATSSDTPSQGTFASELRYTRDPHDVAAVMRWGLRHLQLDGNTFGSSDNADWYRSFVDSERLASYPPKAFDEILAPLLPESHAQLLRATLDLVSSLAAHSEENGISGNKLSKVLGWWIVSSRDVRGVGWREFYIQWETAARQFEHLFLAYIRAQAAQSRMPKRLTELVKNYPFAKYRREDDGIFLPRSRFSTRSASALFVRITVGGSGAASHPHPLRIVEDAFKAQAENHSTSEFATLWQDIRKIASKSASSSNGSDAKSEEEDSTNSLNFASILADETIRLLSLVPTPDGPAGPTLSLFTPLPASQTRRSLSISDVSPAIGVTDGGMLGSFKDVPYSDNAKASPTTSHRELDVAADWQAFSSAGFQCPSGLSLAASLWDNDTEVTQPTPKKGSTGKRNATIKSSSPRAASVDSPPVRPPSPPQPGRITHGMPQLVKLDEAFIDFWADTLLDAIAKTWPTFVVCQLKSIPTLRVTESDKPIEWLVIERTVVDPVRASAAELKNSLVSGKGVPPTPASPTRSESTKSSRWSTSGLAASRKRWSMFSQRHESSSGIQGGKSFTSRKGAKEAGAGEMGEILREEDEGKANGMKVNGEVLQAPNMDADKKHNVASPPPAIANGVSKLAEPVIAAGEEFVIPKDIELAVAAADLQRVPHQALEPAAEPMIVLGDDQSRAAESWLSGGVTAEDSDLAQTPQGRSRSREHLSSPATPAAENPPAGDDLPASTQPAATRHDATKQPFPSDKLDGLSTEAEVAASADVSPPADGGVLESQGNHNKDSSESVEGLRSSTINRPVEEASLVNTASSRPKVPAVGPTSGKLSGIPTDPSDAVQGSDTQDATSAPVSGGANASHSGIPAHGEEPGLVNPDATAGAEATGR